MKRTRLFNHIQIDGYSATPKYLQLTNSIKDAILAGKIKKDDLLPSINELSCILEISRDTAEKGYKHLKSLGIVNSVPGKGYYISNVDFRQRLRIFLLFNKLSSHKKIVYDAFVAALGEHVAIDFYIYNNDFALFKKLLDNKKEDYSHYVIIPHFIEGGEESYRLINEIPKDKLVLLDKLLPGVDGEYAAVYENFEKDIYNALEQARDQLSKYHTLKIIFPDKSYFPNEIIKGFNRFCQQYAFSHKIVNDISTEPIQEGEVFINLMEADLVTLIERIISLKLKVGKQVGVISYNETPLKKVILNGITTISTDFSKMGELAAQLILSNSHAHAEVPFHLTLRPSL
ncbi:MAG: GntR family transcriptional regulator [Daejeonella sp.]|uniref:GntR family transcriptional regulator n=1 Tax=Daejeonella sp. TaxID=2805397 RepID=UPI0027370527|nr:GntR family transcriptional regulator [Daejeonella sp.]MDP3466937.1 GntR family transcriptional regulator [Daejeonella sp.]